jgi:hypothetical protein
MGGGRPGELLEGALDDPDEWLDELELEGDLDPHEAEMLRVEVQRLARRHGVELSALEIRTAPSPPPSA